MKSDFERALESICGDARAISASTLAMLSSPSRAERAAFAAVWMTLSPDARRAIISRMFEASEASVDLDLWDLFRHCLGDDDADVRTMAIEGLWEDERADLVALLLPIVNNDPVDQVRAAAATALGRFLYLAECDELDQELGAAVREALERIVLDRTQPIAVARRALESLAHIDDERIRGLIDWAYEHGDELLRASALFAMGRSADPVWADTVLEELESESPAIRYEAAHASGEIQIQRAVEPLIALAHGSDADIRLAAIWALGQIGGPRARHTLQRLADSADENTALAAEEAIAELQFCKTGMNLMVTELDDQTSEAWDDDELEQDDETYGGDDDEAEEEWDDEPLDLDSL